MRTRKLGLVLLLFLVALLFTTAVSAQSTATCASVIQAAQTRSGTNCANLPLNTTCVGSGPASSVSSSGVVPLLYTDDGDRRSLATTHTLISGPLNVTIGNYGINVLNVQGGLPANTRKGAIYVLFGGVTLTNVGGVGQRIWQSVRLSSQDNPAPCAGVAPLLLIQNPQDVVSTTLTVNSLELQLHSTIAVQLIADSDHPPRKIIQICVLEGSVSFGVGAHAVTMERGYCVTARLNPTGKIIPGSLSDPFMISPEALAIILTLTDGLPANLLNHPIGHIGVTCPSGIGDPICTITG